MLYSNDKTNLLEVLHSTVIPVTGCTEPLSVAYSAAIARKELSGELERLEIIVDSGLYKNAAKVAIPGIPHRGLIFAAALGWVGGHPEAGLNSIKEIGEIEINAALALVETDIIHISVHPDCLDLYIHTECITDKGKVYLLTKGTHDNIISIKKDIDITPEECITANNIVENRLSNYDLESILSFITNVNVENLKFLHEGFLLNNELAAVGIKISNGIGNYYSQIPFSENKKFESIKMAKCLCSAASEARMSGVQLPAMSVAGSGNHGITAFLGIKAICDVYEIDEERMLRAIAFTILITAYIKMETGVLSAMCGCGVAAGIGLSAGITYILNGDLVDISGAMMNMVGSISGIICDGAKEGCALKLALASGWAVECSILALNKMVINSTDGIVNSDFRKLFSNLGIICSACGLSVNQEIVKILENNRVELL